MFWLASPFIFFDPPFGGVSIYILCFARRYEYNLLWFLNLFYAEKAGVICVGLLPCRAHSPSRAARLDAPRIVPPRKSYLGRNIHPRPGAIGSPALHKTISPMRVSSALCITIQHHPPGVVPSRTSGAACRGARHGRHQQQSKTAKNECRSSFSP